MLAGIMGAPELAIEIAEANALANAAANVARHYNLEAGQKTLDWANFAMVLGAIYGTRVAATMVRRKNERAAKRATQQATGSAMPQSPSPPGGPIIDVGAMPAAGARLS